MEKIQGRPLPLGAVLMQDKVNFAAAVPEGKSCNLLLYKAGEESPCGVYPMEHAVGSVYTAAFTGLDAGKYEYNLEIDGEVCLDPYARALAGRSEWLQEREIAKHEVRCRIVTDGYDWEGDTFPQIPYHQVVAYALHVRGFTKDASSKVKHKGTFRGVMEKLSYLKELGINQIQCMPVYEFEENGVYTNYWGYGDASYFVPKSAYAADGDGVRELKDMVKACHREGIEVVLEMPFVQGIPAMTAAECLRYYVLEYHIDGFVLNPYTAAIEDLKKDPVLGRSKLIRHQEDFQNTMRRFLKGDEGMIGSVMHWLKHHSEADGICNTITSHTGFTLNDLVSYDGKHNEANGENNQDGPDYNYSWNCGVEGETRKKAVAELRKNQVRNALFLLFLSQGTPCLLAGDEFGNSQKGNNNVYCQDNPTGWVNWKHGQKEQELCRFVRELIALRKSLPVLCPEEEPLGVDRSGCGVPDISYHGESAWRVQSEVSSRQLGVYYSAAVSGGNDCFIAYNMHWLEHEFALPSLSGKKNWYLAASTKEGVLKTPELIEEKRKIEIPPRTIMVMIGR